MRFWMKETLSRLASHAGLAVVSKRKQNEMAAQRCALLALLKQSLRKGRFDDAPLVEGVVFSKDRPMQLHTLLSSYFEKVTSAAPLHVLYRASSERFEAAYLKVVGLFAGRPVDFQREASFRDDLIGCLEKLKSEKLFFLVDDIVFVDAVDVHDFAQFDTEQFVPSLRLGTNLRRCYTARCVQRLPRFLDGVIEGDDKACWRWRDGEWDWGYALSVDGHLFSTLEISVIAKVVEFSAPNSFESALQSFHSCFKDRYGVCYTRAKVVNIPCNKVQRENANAAGDVDPDLLLDQWERGLQIDYRRLYGIVNESAHQEIPLVLVRR